MTEPQRYRYDVFVSYSQDDWEWVKGWLLPRFETAGLAVCVDTRCFEPGAPILEEQARAVEQSRKTILILSPTYLESQWNQFESLLVQTLDPGAVKRQLIPVLHRSCQLSLRLRPLVSVDLTEDDPQQWQRLLKALEPGQPTALSPAQRLSLAIADASPSAAALGWHPLGTLWLLLGLMCLVLLVGLAYLRLYNLPVLRSTASMMTAALVSLLGFLGLREDRDFFQRLSYYLGKSRLAWSCLTGLLILTVVLWAKVGWPDVQAAAYGPLGPREPGVQRFAIGDWKNLTTGTSPYEGVWTEGTRRALYQKLSKVKELQGIAAGSPQVTDEVRRDLDLWIDGGFSKISAVKLTADISGRGGQYLQTVSVVRDVDENSSSVDEDILATQNALAQEILSALRIELPADDADAMLKIPTTNPHALQLNNEAVVIMSESGSIAQAEALLREALALDSNYADAHNNLGFVLRIGGDLNSAIAEYRIATELLPRYPIFHFNLGLAYDLANEFDAAIRSYKQAIDFDPSYARAMNNLAFVYMETGDLGEAQRWLQRGLSLEPGAAALHKNLGRVYLEKGRTTGAIDELTQAIELFDPYAEALYYLARAYQQAGQPEDACRILNQYTPLAAADSQDEPDRPLHAEALAAELSCP